MCLCVSLSPTGVLQNFPSCRTRWQSLKEFKKAVDAYEKIKFDFADSQEAADIDKYIARASAASAN